MLIGRVGGYLSWSLAVSTPAFAACHHFTVTASPTSVSQGGKVTVSVSRDGNFAASNVRVSTVDETAKAPEDYSKLGQNVTFTNEKSRTFSVAIAKDTKSDPAETFRLHLSNPGGCAPNPNYVLDPDMTVTIMAHTVATPKPVVHTAAPAATRPPTVPVVSSTASPSPSPTVAVTASPDTTPTPLAAAIGGKKTGGRSALAIAGIAVGAVAVISAAALFFYRRRLA